MNKEDIEENLGTVARSGSRKFVEEAAEKDQAF